MRKPHQHWNIHICALTNCREYTGWLWRIEMNTPWWHLGIALRPDAKYARTDGSAWVSGRRFR